MADQRLPVAGPSKAKKPRSSGENPKYRTDELLRILEDVSESDFESSDEMCR